MDAFWRDSFQKRAVLLKARPLDDVRKRTVAELARAYDGTVWGGGASLVKEGVPAWVMSRNDKDILVNAGAVERQ